MPGFRSGLVRPSFGAILQWGVTASAIAAGSLWVTSFAAIPEPVATKSIDSPAPPPRQRVVVTRREIELLNQETFFIVGSEARAEVLRKALEEDCGVRLNMGLAPLGDVVIVAGTDVEAAAVIAAINDGNRTRVGMSVAEARIIDLR